jgi:hypothetical protein
MSNSNLPPGVSPNDIPGNRPEDLAEEAFWIELDNAFEIKYGKQGHDWLEWQEHADSDDLLFQYVTMARDVGYNRGYQDGGRDEAMSHSYRECDHKWRNYSEYGGDFKDNPVICRDCGETAPPDVTESILQAEREMDEES